MHSATFIGEVQQGRLHIGQPLADFEGKQVLVTLIAPNGSMTQATPNVPPVELDVEVELDGPMPVTAENLGPRPVRTVAASPCLIFPVGVADE